MIQYCGAVDALFDDLIEKERSYITPAYDVLKDVPLENMLAFIGTALAQPGYREA